jgi:chromate transport protein ChrA
LARAIRFWLKLGFINFGGPAARRRDGRGEVAWVERRLVLGPDRMTGFHVRFMCMR